MTGRIILLTFLYVFAFRSMAQFKFGLAAGYEHITSTPNDNMGSGGGFSGSLHNLSSGILPAPGQNVGFQQYLARNTCRHSC
jgi:hypothetical protein